jgi:hypothetical protein
MINSETSKQFLNKFVKRNIKTERNKFKEIFDYYEIPTEDQTYENFILLAIFDGIYDWTTRKSNTSNLKLIMDILYGEEKQQEVNKQIKMKFKNNNE